MPVAEAEKRTFEPEVAHLDGKVAIITGGTTGIGRATALLLSRRGVRVVVYGRHQQELDDTLHDLGEAGGQFHGLIADNAYEDQILNVFAETRRVFGDPGILINNAAL
ncbi:MAG TPA: SDR family NAD(P)-dependent oxidoreductase, partial [Armatimonadota bacterium]|nr:SDR family NAD(P)-dependent oxidoreductase [Armatimonadota bacterium]